MKKRLWFVTLKADCPLGFAERLVLSSLVSKARHGKSVTARRIAKVTGLHRGSSVSPALAALQRHRLAEKTTEGWRALPPSGEAAQWFVSRKGKSEHWHERLAYFPVSLPDRSKVSTRHAVVYWFLVARSRLTRPQKIAGIAKALRIGWATASRAVKKLQKMGLIDSDLRPTQAQRDDLWLEGKKPRPPKKPEIVDNYRMSALFKAGMSFEGFKSRSAFDEHVDRIGTVMRRAGYSAEDIHGYIRATYESFGKHLRDAKLAVFLRWSLEVLFARAERETEKNRAAGRFQGKNSLGLLSHMTQSFVQHVNKEHEFLNEVEWHLFMIAA
jgi:hypothetical protein